MIDTHAHINFKPFNQDLDQVIQRAKDAGLLGIVVVGVGAESNAKAIDLSKRVDFLHAAIGIHPADTKEISQKDMDDLRALARSETIVAIGECGLDYYWNKEDSRFQKALFKQQIELAIELDLPLIIHMRDATEDTYALLKEYQGRIKGVMHCYSGSPEMALKFIDLGLYISLGGPVTFLNAKTPKEVAKVVPLNRLLIETDCPYLAPHPYRGKRNEPSYLSFMAEAVATARQEDVQTVIDVTTKNARKLFQLEDV